jgi:uncharacterized membrane protein YeaQ/YmgE (transglycosylase-associated protein family)
MFHIVGQLITGLIVGAIAQILLIGNDPGGWSLRGFLITMAIGVAGSFVGTLAGRMIWKDENYRAGWIVSIAGALVLLLIFRVLLKF